MRNQILAVLIAVMAPQAFLMSPALAEEPTAFSFHLLEEPSSLDPVGIRGINSRFLFYNLFRPLYRYDESRGLQPEAAKSCQWKSTTQLICQLRSDFKWSDGSPVKGADYVRSFQRLFAPQQKSEAAEIFVNLKNASKILKGEAKPETLGVSSASDYLLTFDFDQNDPEFLYKLIESNSAAIRETPLIALAPTVITNGPYKVREWIVGKKAILEPNPHFVGGAKLRPLVEVYFLQDHITAVHLFDAKKLSFLRHVATNQIQTYAKMKGFMRVPTYRFSYIGFGKSLQIQPLVRRALINSVKYSELQKLLDSRNPLGCPGVPIKLSDRKRPCYTYDPRKAAKSVEKLPEDWKSKRLVFLHSQAGSDDFSIIAQWFQNQWKTELGLNVEIETREAAVFMSEVRTRAPDIFYRTLLLDRPTCLSALENFLKGNPENSIGFDYGPFANKASRLAVERSESKRKTLCTQALKDLMEQNVMIPLGEPEMTMVHDSLYQGFSINSMNQLDLARLEPVAKPK